MDFNRFARTAIWFEYWNNHEKEEEFSKPIFKTNKNNLPKNYSSPKGLKNFLDAIRSEIMDPRNRNEEKSNLPPEEIKALKELIRLQKERIIVIKAADKGAGIVILNFQDYIKACYEHLLSSVPSESEHDINDPKMYYKPVNEFALEEAKTRIEAILRDALEEKIITKSEYTAMNPSDKDPSKFYFNFKEH